MILQSVYGFCFFSLIFFAGALFWSATFDLKEKERALLSSCLMSLVHGVPASLIAAWQIYSAYPLRVDALNSSRHTRLLQYTLAYMLADTALYLIPYTPGDFLFLVHHFVVVLYICSSLRVSRGAISCIYMLCLGEATSVFQNGWYTCKTLSGSSKVASQALTWLDTMYPASYLFVRSIVGPPAVFWLTLQVWNARRLPLWCRATWVCICVISLAGSQLWSFNLLKELNAGNSKAKHLAEKIA